MIKLYYNDKPQSNLLELVHDTDSQVWKWTSWNERPTTFYQLLNAIGIEYEWSNDPKDSIVVADLGSIDFSNMPDKKIEELCDKYKKVLLFTSQEPWELLVILRRLEKFNNLYIMDCTSHTYNCVCYDHKDIDRYLPFPSMIPLTVSTERCNTHIYTNGIDNHREVFMLYNCMMNKWRPTKHFLYHALDHINKLGDGITTFRSPHWQDIANAKNDIFQHIDHDDCRESLPEDYKERLLKDESWEINKDLDTYHIKDIPFDVDFRAWPEQVFLRTAFSLVCESESSRENCCPYVSEKFLYPILNGHPVFTYGPKNFNRMIKELGFALHEEVFNFDFDTIEADPLRALKMVEQIRPMKCMAIRDLKFDYEVCRHNQHLINNRGSKLWVHMQETMKTYLEQLQY